MNHSHNRFLLTLLFISSTAATAVAQTTPTLDSEQSAFLTLINNYRNQNGAGPLQVSVTLQNSSQWMSNDMASKNYFSHTDSLGRNPFNRMAAFGYPASTQGENIAAGYSDAQNTFNQWVTACDADTSGSCTYAHRQNMLNSAYKVLGIGRVYSASSTYRWYWTTDFGSVVDQTVSGGSTSPSSNPVQTPAPPANVPPTVDSVTPSTGTGTTQTFAFNYSSANGYAYLNEVYALINSSLTASGGCYVYYQRAGNTLSLVNDAGTAYGSPVTPGAAGTLQNSQCTINAPGVTVSGTKNTLTLNLPVTFKSAVTGTQTLYGYALDKANLNSGWRTLGTWNPTAAVVSAAPKVNSVTPNTGGGASQKFTFIYSSGNGYAYLKGVYALINGSLSGYRGCYVYYQRSNRSLYLVNDDGTAFLTPLTPGLGGTLQNSQCTIDGASSSVSEAGPMLTLTLAVKFTPSFSGNQSLYGYALDNGNLNSGWQAVGTWRSQ